MNCGAIARGVCLYFYSSFFTRWSSSYSHVYSSRSGSVKGSSTWRNFISTCNHDILNWLSKCMNIMRNWIMIVFHEKRQELSTNLMKIRFLIYISYNIYIFNNCLMLFEIVDHWSDDCDNFKRALLRLKKIDNRYIEENLMNCVFQVFNEVDLSSKWIEWYIRRIFIFI